MEQKQIRTYASRQPNSDTYAIMHSGRDSYIPVFESEEGERKLRASHPAFDKAVEDGLELVIIDVSPLVSARLLDEKKLYNFH